MNEFYQVKNAPRAIGKKGEASKLELESGSCKDMPMRPWEHSALFRRMNGYRPARGDFETEMSDSFEMKFIQDLEFESDVTTMSKLRY